MITKLGWLAPLMCGMPLFLGCSGQKVEDFATPTNKARQALESALQHWQEGQPPGTVPGASPVVEVVDSQWKAGQRLLSFEILGEESAGEQRFFKVRLTLARGGEKEARYAVLGIDPVWVYREEDYKNLSGMGKK